jgi:hypothetical protein
MVSIPNMEKFFQDKAVYPSRWKDGNYTIEVREISELKLISGFIVACDPFMLFSDKEPFLLRIGLGLYPVSLSIAHIDKHGSMIMAAIIRFSDQKPVKWEMALCENQDVNELSDDEIWGYGVDSGNGSFMDVEAYKLLQSRVVEEPDYVGYGRSFDELIYNELKKTRPRWANILLDDKTGLNAMLFQSGMGDGAYASYWGHAADGKVICLVTVFDDMELDDEMDSEDEL